MSIFNRFKKTSEKENKTEQKSAKSLLNSKIKDDKKAKAGMTSDDKNQEAKKETKKSDVKKSSHKVGRKIVSYGILVRPLITEKATDLSQFNQYVFEVSTKANKIQITEAVESRYGIRPIKVNVINNSGTAVRYGRNTGRTKGKRKAVITLPEGKNIKIHEGV